MGFGSLGLMSGILSACGGGGGGNGPQALVPVPAPAPAPSPIAVQPSPQPTETWRMPDESAPHRAVWMAFAARESVWTAPMRQPVQQALARIANAISVYEPVKMLVGAEDFATARQLCGSNVELIQHEIDDLWMRDTGCVFVRNMRGERAAVSFNFNGWGNRQPHTRDATVAARMAELAGVPLLRSRLVMEGGGIEVDGEGTAIITESCVLNANRNPGLGKEACEAELKRLLGLRKIIWLPGIAGRDITDGHTDFYARFASPGVVVAGLDEDPGSYDRAVTRRHLEILKQATDARGQRLRVEVLRGPDSVRRKLETPEFAAGYINFYVCNGAVIAPQFGDSRADGNARSLLQELFPRREVVQLDIDAIAAGGGGIHCTTQQQPG